MRFLRVCGEQLHCFLVLFYLNILNMEAWYLQKTIQVLDWKIARKEKEIEKELGMSRVTGV